MQRNRDGCDCPPAVLMCCHFDGRLVTLWEGEMAHEAHSCGCNPARFCFGVFENATGITTCPCVGCAARLMARWLTKKLFFPTLPAAEVAFSEAREALRLASPALL